MKKHLLAVAVATAVAAPAFAQNVSMTGVFDAGFGAVDRGGASDPNRGYVGMVGNTLATSQINFNAAEDLGGGLKASLQIQRQFSALNGQDSGATNGLNTSNVGFDTVALTLSSAMGTVAIGKMDHDTRELGGIGRYGNFGRTTGFTRIGDERDATINIKSATFNGFTLMAGYSADTGSGYQTGTSMFGKSTSVGATYAMGDLKIGASVTQGDYSLAGTAASTTKARDTILAASYNLGVVELGLVAASSDLDKNSNASSLIGKRSVTAISAKAPLANGLAILGSIQTMKNNGESSDNKARGFQVAVTKDLSKRTTVYVVHSSVDNNSNVAFATRGMIAPASAGDDASATLVGIRHSF